MLLTSHGYDENDPDRLIPDDDNPLIFFNSNRNLMKSIFGDNQEIFKNGYQNYNLSRPTVE